MFSCCFGTALKYGSSKEKEGEGRERRMTLRFSGLRFLHLVPGGFCGLGGWWFPLGEINGKRGGTGGAEPCKSLLCDADGMRRSSMVLNPFQNSSTMSRTHMDGCPYLGLSNTDAKQEAGPESSRADKRDGKGM